MLSRDRAKGTTITTPRKESPFRKSRRLEAQYSRELRKVARNVGDLVNAFQAGDPSALPALRNAMAKYSETLEPWARATATRLLAQLEQQSKRQWAERTRGLAKSLRDELLNAPTGKALQEYLEDQVRLITSLPTDAAQRVHELTLKGLEDSTRAKEIAAEIARTGQVTESRANLIARTEVSRTSSGLTMARAQHVGSDGYIWRSSGDSDVRDSHARMDGKFVRWDSPPTLDGLTGHAGALPNCRCYPEPVIPEVTA